MNEPTDFELVTTGGGLAGPGTAVLEAGTDASYLMFTVLGGLAEFERDLIRARTSEGRERAKARDVKLGVKPKLTEHQRHEAIWRRDCDGEPLRDIVRIYNVSHSTISRLTARRANLSDDEATIR
jgi:DNA invertase Pin-like site-specific DNA recombinase